MGDTRVGDGAEGWKILCGTLNADAGEANAASKLSAKKREDRVLLGSEDMGTKIMVVRSPPKRSV